MLFNDVDVNEFLVKNDIDEQYASLFIAEIRRYLADKENYTLDFDGNTIILKQRIIKINKGLDYLEGEYFSKNIDLKYLDLNNNPSKASLIAKYSKAPEKGFYLYGKNGVGKTSLVVGLCNHHYNRTKEQTLFVFWPDFIEKTKRFNKNSFEYINRIKYCSRLIIDDLGQESITSWSRDDILSSIITYRLERNLFTIITSNYLVEELKNLYTLKSIENKKAVALANKINSLCPEHLIIGEDYRRYDK